MDRKLASIQKVTSVEPIEGADRIEKIRVMGWDVVAQKAEFKTGDQCVFFEIDSLLPDSNPEFAFMERSKYRVRTMKLRGVLSQGLALPLSVLDVQMSDHHIQSPPWEEGADVTELLGVTQWEPPAKFNMGGIRGNFPFYVPKTDETRVQSALGTIDELRGLTCYITEKVDGTSATFSHRDGDFHVCSRNLSLKPDDASAHWRMARKYDLEKKLPELGNFAIQAEMCGPRVQNNRLMLKGLDIFVFSIYDIDNTRFLGYNDMMEVVIDLGLNPVKTLGLPATVFDMDLDGLLEMAEGTYEGTDNPREGIVVRPMEEQYSATLQGRLSFKVLSNTFLLKEK